MSFPAAAAAIAAAGQSMPKPETAEFGARLSMDANQTQMLARLHMLATPQGEGPHPRVKDHTSAQGEGPHPSPG